MVPNSKLFQMRQFSKDQSSASKTAKRRTMLFILAVTVLFGFLCYSVSNMDGCNPANIASLVRNTNNYQLNIKHENPAPQICLVYDRPPRTGSSTAGRAFQECWEKLNFDIVNKERLKSDDDTIQVLVKSGAYVAATSYHFIVTEDDIVSLTTRCKNLYYVTSTRTLRERIISTALGSVEKHTFTFADNVTMSEDEIPVAMSIANQRANALERKLESYPYRNTEERITPDYIIRYQNFSEDLAGILQAFGCSGSFESVNIHILGEGAEEGASDVDSESDEENVKTANQKLQDMQFNLTRNDSRHVEMSKLAELVNQPGLAKARRLAALRRSMELY